MTDNTQKISRNALKSLFNQFDFSKKGHLTDFEYKALCYSQMIRPVNKNEKVSFEELEATFDNQNATKEEEDSDDSILQFFYFLSSDHEFITEQSLKKATTNLSLDIDYKKMIHSFSDTGQIDFKTFKNIFRGCRL
ncbi:putative EF-hand-like domain protein [Pseudoloma neurophilia]|uniref:Putative EF-hand-like domain protein n=1 Tax=Pseudoloma neurophilia TaxID=146866 RepID=A0A0R0M0A4_9MICR|nr:putative EF-hand-like domain protein [Pseudoloma neurophilia]